MVHSKYYVPLLINIYPCFSTSTVKRFSHFFRKKIFRLFIAASCLLLLISFGIIPWKCPIKSLFGIECPGCGFTRGLFAIFDGRISDALALNPLSIAAVFVFSLFIVLCVWEWFSKKPVIDNIYLFYSRMLKKNKRFLLIISVLYVVTITLYKNKHLL